MASRPAEGRSLRLLPAHPPDLRKQIWRERDEKWIQPYHHKAGGHAGVFLGIPRPCVSTGWVFKEDSSYAAGSPQSRRTPRVSDTLPGFDVCQSTGVQRNSFGSRPRTVPEKNKKRGQGLSMCLNSGLRVSTSGLCCVVAASRVIYRILAADYLVLLCRHRVLQICATRNFPWGKNLSRGGARGIFRSAENFFTPWGLARNRPRALAPRPHAQS